MRQLLDTVLTTITFPFSSVISQLGVLQINAYYTS